PGRRSAGAGGRLGGAGAVPAGRPDLRPGGVDPDGQLAGVAQRGRRGRHRVVRGRPGQVVSLSRPRIRRALVAFAAWAVVAVPIALYTFTHSSAPLVLAGHDVVLTPTLDGRVVLRMGPYLPDVRMDSGGRIGV